jgi:hypothetical protein
VEALHKAYSAKGVSFYYVLSREPHPGFYGFVQPDRLEMRQEYTGFARAELQSEIPWIIDNMDNTLQKTYGGMPNADFIIDSDGTLLMSNEWADPDKVKAFLEDRFGPSNISDEEWEKLSQGGMAMTGNNDEVPQMEVPRLALSTLAVKSLNETETLPYSVEAGTLPTGVTAEGKSRLYLTIRPDKDKNIIFDREEPPINIQLSDAKGISFGKDQLVSGKARNSDNFPHSLGVIWTANEDAEDMEFLVSIKAKFGIEGQELTEKTSKFLISGPIPIGEAEADEVPAIQFQAVSQLEKLKMAKTSEDQVPMSMETRIELNPNDPQKGKIYFILNVDNDTGHKWNNLATAPEIAVSAVSGIKLDKELLKSGDRKDAEDAEKRILSVGFTLESGSNEVKFEATPQAWICNNDLGWCRYFDATYEVTGKF